MIDIRDLCYFAGGKTILKDINLSVKNGEKIALIGPSGAGKSSLMNILTQRVEATTGEVFINQQSLKTIKDNRQLASKIGLITQSADLIEALDVRKNVLMGNFRNWSFLGSLKHTLIKPQNIQDILKSIDMEAFEKRRVHELSGGEKQRVAIARLIVQDPEIFLADEPVASLDPSLSESILRLLLSVSRDKPLVVSLHQQELALKYFDRIIAIKAGQIVFDGKANQLTSQQLEQLYAR